MRSRMQQSSIHRIIVLPILTVVFFILGAIQSHAADAVPGCKLLASVARLKPDMINLHDNYVKIWEYDGDDEHNNLSDLENKKTYVLIHGNGAGPAGSNWPLPAARAIRATKQGEKSQILLIDWQDDAALLSWHGFDPDNADVVHLICLAVQSMFSHVSKIDNVEIIGHSYGAHIGGWLAQVGVIGTVTRMVALDPATEKRDLTPQIASTWINLKNSSTYVESYMSSSNLGNVTYTYGNDNFVIASEELLSYDNFTGQLSTDGLETHIESALETANHSRAWEFYLSTINNSSRVGWGWFYRGKKEYHDIGFATEENTHMSSNIPLWRGVILTPDTMECIDSNSKKTGIGKWYKEKITRSNYSALISAVCKAVDYTNISSNILENQVFETEKQYKITVSTSNNIINNAFLTRALQYGQLVQGACIKVWLAKTKENIDYSKDAKLIGCKTIFNHSPEKRDYSTEITLDFTGVNPVDYKDGAFLHIQVGAQSRTLLYKYSGTDFNTFSREIVSVDPMAGNIYYHIPEASDLKWEQGACGYITGEVNTDDSDNLLVIPIQFEDSVDLCFLFDTTGSMQGVLNNCKQNAIRNLSSILDTTPGARVAVAEYRDIDDSSFIYRGVCNFTNNKSALISGINSLYADEGGDEPEAAYYSLIQCMMGREISSGTTGGWRKKVKSRSIIFFTDAPSNNYGNCTYADVINFAKNPSTSIVHGGTRGESDDDDETPFTIYAIVPTDAASYYADITAATGGKVVTTYSSNEVSDAIIEIIEEIIENIDGTAAPWYPSYTFNCEHDHKAHEVWVFDGETLVTKMVVNSTTVTAADYLKAGCPGLESGKEYTFRVYEWEGKECAAESTYTPEYNKPSSGTVTAEATENAEIYNLRISVPSASKFTMTVYRGEEVCFPATEFIFTDTDDKGQIITSKNVKMEFFEAGEYTVEVFGSNLAGTADSPVTCTVTIAEEPVISEYAAWPETGYTPEEGQTLLQAGDDMMVTFTWPAITDADHYNLQVYDSYGKLVKTVNNVIDCHTTVKLTDDVYYWVMEAVLFNGNVLSSTGRSFVVAIKSDAPIISRVEAIEGEPTKVLLVCDKASSNYAGISYDIQFYTAESGWKNYMEGRAIAVTFSDEDGDGVYTGAIDFKSNVSGAYLLIRPKVNGRLVTDKQTLYRLP